MDQLTALWNAFAEMLQKVLPTSPFAPIIEGLSIAGAEYLGWLNWFVPVGSMLTIFTAWLSAIALYYLYSIILRWLKVVGG